MEPRTFLNLLSKEWVLMVEIFESTKHGPVDHGSLTQLIEIHKKDNNDNYDLFDRLLEYGVLGQPLSGETLYQLGGLAETIISQLLQEQRLGLSESVQAHIVHLDELSQKLLKAATGYETADIVNVAKKLWQHTQDIKHQVSNNLAAIRNIVAEAKKRESNKPLRVRYADVIDAWEQYITPMGEMVEPHGAFDSIIDSAIGRMDQAIHSLESSSSSLMSEVSNVRSVRQMLNDMRWHTLSSFQIARDVLKPLYEVARLNSKVTRGVSIILDDLQKGRIHNTDTYAPFPIYRRPQLLLVSQVKALITYYCGVKEVERSPSPMILLPLPVQRQAANRVQPLNPRQMLRQLKNDSPIEDIMGWAIDHFPEFPTSRILDIVSISFTEPSFTLTRGEKRSYRTATHRIEGPSLTLENISD